MTAGHSADRSLSAAHQLRDIAAADAIDADSLLAGAESVTVQVIQRSEDKVRASIGGAVYTLPARVLDALDNLDDGRPLPARSLLTGASADLSTCTGRTLVRIGVLRVV